MFSPVTKMLHIKKEGMIMNSSPHTGIAERIRTYYPQYPLTQSGDNLVIQLPLGRLEIKGLRLFPELFGKQLKSITFPDETQLYEGIESFLLAYAEEEKACNCAYQDALEQANKTNHRAWIICAIAFSVSLVLCVLLDRPPVLLILTLLIPLLAPVLEGILRKATLRRCWVCPHCGKPLPVFRDPVLLSPRHVSACPQCGCNLLDGKQAQQRKAQFLSERFAPEISSFDPGIQPRMGGRAVPIFSGTVLLLFVLLFLLPILTGRTVPLYTAVKVFILACVLASGLALLRFSRKKAVPERPILTVCEPGFLSVLGPVTLIVSLIFLFPAVLLEDAPTVISCGALGLVFLMGGVWMLLSRRNRCLLVYPGHLIYTDCLNRRKDIPRSRLSQVRFTSGNAMKFLDSEGKKLFSLENNMAGMEAFFDWLDREKMPCSLTRSLQKKAGKNTAASLSWREEYRTPLHSHLPIIRIGMYVCVALLAAGCILPIILYILDILSITQTVCLSSLSPLPLVIWYLCFAPVTLAGNRPAEATPEWNAMHIRFPVILFDLLNLGIFYQIAYIWSKYHFQIADFVGFLVLNLVITGALIVLTWLRTPKRLRKEDGWALLILGLLLVGYCLSYGLSLGLSGKAEHYPAQVTERKIFQEDDKTEASLTVILDDGSSQRIQVSTALYDLEGKGEDLVVCQKKNFLGIRMVRLHLASSVKKPPAD